MARKRSSLEEATWAATFIEWESVEDSYEEGELERSHTVLAESIFITARTPDELIEEVASRYGLPVEDRAAWVAFDGRLDCGLLVDDDNMQATDRDVEEWKKGRKRLWSAHISVYVAQVSIRRPSTTEIARAFRVEDAG